jgi:hypothetical protein
MKYKELVKKASQTGAFMEREAELEKVATVQRYMDYGLSFDVASALVKSAALSGAAAKKIAKTTDDVVSAVLGSTAKNSENIAKTLDNGKKVWGAITNPEAKEKAREAATKLEEEAKSHRRNMLSVGGAALGVGGLSGLAVGVGASRNSRKMPEYN